MVSWPLNQSIESRTCPTYPKKWRWLPKTPCFVGYIMLHLPLSHGYPNIIPLCPKLRTGCLQSWGIQVQLPPGNQWWPVGARGKWWLTGQPVDGPKGYPISDQKNKNTQEWHNHADHVSRNWLKGKCAGNPPEFMWKPWFPDFSSLELWMFLWRTFHASKSGRARPLPRSRCRAALAVPGPSANSASPCGGRVPTMER